MIKLYSVCFSKNGLEVANKLSALHGCEVAEPFRAGNKALSSWVQKHFESGAALVFIGAAGIAVRAIAPFVKSKVSDPAVIVIDEKGKNVIPILSGHLGRANELSRHIAALLGADAVITTATDVNGVFSPDAWAAENGLSIPFPDRIKPVAKKLLAGETASIKSIFPIEISEKYKSSLALCEDNADIELTVLEGGAEDSLVIVPKAVVLGLGCRRGVSSSAIEMAVKSFCRENHIFSCAIAAVSSIEQKADEAGILEFCESHALPFETFCAGELEEVRGSFCSSKFVENTVGVDNVCERAAIALSGAKDLLVKKTVCKNITLAAAVLPHEFKI